MDVFGRWTVVSSPDFDDEYLRMDVDPYVELRRDGKLVSGEYHVGLQQGNIDGRLESNARAVFSFEGADEMDSVHGRGEFHVEEAQARFVLEYYLGDAFTFICERSEAPDDQT